MVGGIFIWPTGGPSYRSHPPNAYGLDFRDYPIRTGTLFLDTLIFFDFLGYRVPPDFLGYLG